MKLKHFIQEYNVRLNPTYGFRAGSFDLTLRVRTFDEEFTVQKSIHKDELQIQGLFDIIFDDLKEKLKRELLDS